MNAVIETQSKPAVPVPEPLPAGEPFTPRGVAAFSRATFGRLFLVHCIIAALAAVVIVWGLHHAWFPEIQAAIRKLPAKGEIARGKLEWSGAPVVMLNEGRLLSFAVNLDRSPSLRPSSSIQFEFGQTEARASSLFGVARWPYPKGYIVAFNREDLEPWWGAWRTPMLAIALGGTFVGLLLSWWSLALLYFLPIWLLAFLGNRELTLGGSFRLAGAALMPGAVLFASSLLLHASGGLDLFRLLLAAVLHIVMGWIVAGFAILSLPRCQDASRSTGSNPFSGQISDTAITDRKPARGQKNPWAKPDV